MEALSKSLGKVGELILFVLLSIVYTSLIISPLILVNLLIEGSLIRYILLFIPLIGLLGLALERELIAVKAVFIDYKSYYRPYFKDVFGQGFIKKYLTYSLIFSLYFYFSDALRILESGALILFVFRIFLSLIFRNIIFYTILQRAFREDIGFIKTIKNSSLLTFRFPIYAIIIGFVWEVIESLLITNILWTYVLVIIIGFMGTFINETKVKNL